MLFLVVSCQSSTGTTTLRRYAVSVESILAVSVSDVYTTWVVYIEASDWHLVSCTCCESRSRHLACWCMLIAATLIRFEHLGQSSRIDRVNLTLKGLVIAAALIIVNPSDQVSIYQISLKAG